eukprot:PITA_13509
MYSAISLATYRQAQETRVPVLPPPDPHSAYLVLQGNEEEEEDNLLGRRRVRKLPFPQDRCLQIMGSKEESRMYFIPVLGQPISSNRYYVVRAGGMDKGLVLTCSKEEDKIPGCISTRIQDIRPRPLRPNNPYQQMKIIPVGDRFNAKSIASDGYPPRFLRQGDLRIEAKELDGSPIRLAYVGGNNTSSRAQLPPFNFPLSEERSPILTVGEWYCPFIFIDEMGNRFKDPKIQVMETPFYRMHLEKFWQEIYSTEISTSREDIFVERTIEVEEASLSGSEAVEESRDRDGNVWITGVERERGELKGVRLSWHIIAKMRADQGREASEAIDRDVRVEKSFKNNGIGRKFVCLVIVERYVLSRMDGSVILTYSFTHCDQIKGKWGFK